MNLGLVHKIGKRKQLAHKHLTKARSNFVRLGPSPVLTKIDAALAEL
jgi:hypothetical protein